MLSSHAGINQTVVSPSYSNSTPSVAFPKTLKRLIKVLVAGYIGLVFGVCALVCGLVAGTYQLASKAVPAS